MYRWGPRDFQDERFSYVVMRRGWRQPHNINENVQIAISPNFYQDIHLEDSDIEWTPGKHRLIKRVKYLIYYILNRKDE